MSQIAVTVYKRADLGELEIAAMYALFTDYYADTTVAQFRADLDEKTHIILLYAGVTLCGFSTLTVLDSVQHPGADKPDYRALFSGDTIIHHDQWGEQGLALAFCNLAGQFKAQQPNRPLYWFLISKGYRTYRYLHLFSKEYWPSYRKENMPELQGVLEVLARQKFGAYFDAAKSIIQFPHSRGHLRPDWAQVRPHLHDRPEISFFLKRNPNFAKGAELACITLLEVSNLRSAAQRAFMTGFNQVMNASKNQLIEHGSVSDPR